MIRPLGVKLEFGLVEFLQNLVAKQDPLSSKKDFVKK